MYLPKLLVTRRSLALTDIVLIKVEWGISGDFEEETAIWSGFILACSVFLSLSLPSLPVSYGGLWHPNLETSSYFVCLFEELNVSYNYQTQCPMDKIVHTGLS